MLQIHERFNVDQPESLADVLLLLCLTLLYMKLCYSIVAAITPLRLAILNVSLARLGLIVAFARNMEMHTHTDISILIQSDQLIVLIWLRPIWPQPTLKDHRVNVSTCSSESKKRQPWCAGVISRVRLPVQVPTHLFHSDAAEEGHSLSWWSPVRPYASKQAKSNSSWYPLKVNAHVKRPKSSEIY